MKGKEVERRAIKEELLVTIWNQRKVIDYRTFETSYGLYLTSTLIIYILKISFVLSFQGTKSICLFKVWSEYYIENHTVIQHGFQFVILPNAFATHSV